MLFSFTLGNFRSFYERKTLSLEPASISDHPQNIIKKAPYSYLSAAVVYGANGAGKSNLLSGMGMMKRIVVENFDMRSVSEIPFDPFLLNTSGSQEPTFYEIVFAIGNTRYRYGFEASSTSIHAEWLFAAEKKKAEKPLFLRVAEGIEVMRTFPEGKDLEERTRDNALFLSVVDQFNGRTASTIMRWFRDCKVVTGLSYDNPRGITFEMLGRPDLNELLNNFLVNADLGFDKIKLERRDISTHEFPADIPEDLLQQFIADLDGRKMLHLRSVHKVFDEKGNFVKLIDFDTFRQESAGSNKLIDLSGSIFDTLIVGGVVVIDELDARLHPLLTLSIIRLFQDQQINKNGAQLIFATYDTNLLRAANLRRDQIYFVEKNDLGASDLYSLVEYNKDGKVRKDRSFEKDYLHGRYGGIPYLGDFGKLSAQWQEK
jgi:AAA15 family ATPase/GTPase